MKKKRLIKLKEYYIMPVNNLVRFEDLDRLVKQLWLEESRRKSLTIAIQIANELMCIFGINKEDLPEDEEALDKAFSNAKFKNQKMELWFEKHPYFGSGRVALYHYKGIKYPIESNFFWLNESTTKAKIAATTQLTSNWEDSDLTRLPQYKVGIDFFLNSKANSLSMVITNRGNLRVMEFCEKLSHTQIEILNKLKGCAIYDGIDPGTKEKIPFEPQRTIHHTLWNALELKEVNKKFYLGIADAFEVLCQHLKRRRPENVSEKDYGNDVKIFASRLLGRLLFIWFLRKKGLINNQMGYFDTDDIDSTNYYENKLKTLFFKTLNTPKEKRNNNDVVTPYLNGGLFDPHDNDWADRTVDFPKNWFQELYKHLNEFNFTTDESSTEFEQIAIDPEMLGRVFENLLATIVPETSGAANDRKNKGAFYTPRDIVSYMCKESLKSYFKNFISNEKDNFGIDKLIEMNDSDFLEAKSTGISDLWGMRSEEVKIKLINAINELKILDPACGSGAFPIGLMQLIIKIIERLSAIYDKKIGKFRLSKSNEKNDVYLTKLFIIQQIIYGSDIEPMAVEISRLRTWLSLIIDDKKNIDPLPNLDFNFVCSNSLIPLPKNDGFFEEQLSLFESYDFDFENKFEDIKKRYFNAHTKEEKFAIKKEFYDLQNNNLGQKKFKKDELLSTWNPFDCKNPAGFFDASTMFNVRGFDIVIGNPPYIHFEDIKELSKKLYKNLGYESYEARGDMYTLFYEMGINNLKKNGTLCYITSNKWMRAGYGESLRNYFVKNVDTKLLVDLGSGVFESATVDTNIILIRNSKTKNSISKAITLTTEYRNSNMSDFIKQNAIDIIFKKYQPWVILTKIEQQIRDKIEKYGTPLGDWPDIKINRGILTGCNEAFIINEEKRKEILSNCKSEDERQRTDKLIRPVLRGRDIKQGSYEWAGLYLIALVPSKHYNINDFNAIKDYLESASWSDEIPTGYGKIKLEQTGKKHEINGIKFTSRKLTGNKWFETQDQIAYMDDFNKQKIFYSETNSSNEIKISIIPEEYLADKTCFLVKCKTRDIEKLFKILTSNIFKRYMKNTSPLLGESGISLTKETVNKFPLPDNLNILNYNLNVDELEYIEQFNRPK